MKNRWIIISIILMIIIICILSFLIFLSNKNKKTSYKEDNKNDENVILTTDTSYKVLDSRDLFFSIQDCVNNYYTYIVQKNNRAVYSLLNKEYIKSNNIIVENVFTKIENIGNFEKIFVNKVYSKEIEFDKETQYYIKCTMISENYTDKKEIYIIANFDFLNETYSITPYNSIDIMAYEDIIKNLKEKDNGKTVEVSETTGKGIDIEKNDYNILSIKSITDVGVIKNYIDFYKVQALYFPEEAYNLLDENYKRIKFTNIEDYKIYTKENINKINGIYQYQKIQNNNYTEYISIDETNNKTIIREILPMQFTIEFSY